MRRDGMTALLSLIESRRSRAAARQFGTLRQFKLECSRRDL
jgi:hypothetical protein